MSMGVSIVMPCYNAERFIKQTIESVLNQTYQDFELIIVNDSSNDRSVDIIRSFSTRDNRIKLILNRENLGVAMSRNIGMQNAKYNLIAFLDADDLWHSKKLELQTKFMKQENCAISFTQYYRIDSCGQIKGSVTKIPKDINYNGLLKGNVIAMSTSMFNKDILDSTTIFEKIGHEDYLFWLKMLKNTVVAKGLREKLVYYRVHPNSLSYSKFKAISYTWLIYRKKLNIGFLKSAYYFVVHEYRAIKKRLQL